MMMPKLKEDIALARQAGPALVLESLSQDHGYVSDGEEPWVWRLNGTRLFLRGANLIPTIYMGEVERAF